MPLPPAQHGTRSGYNRHRQKGEEACDPCRAANAAYAEERRRAAGMRPQVDVSAEVRANPPPHGTQARYGWSIEPCRCSDCREAHAADCWERRHRLDAS